MSRSALVKLAGAHCSVWTEWARRDVSAYLGVERVVLVGADGDQVPNSV